MAPTDTTSYNLRWAREQLGISHADAARRLQMRRGTYARYELGLRTPREPHVVARIEAFLADVRSGGAGRNLRSQRRDGNGEYGLREFGWIPEPGTVALFTLWWDRETLRRRLCVADGTRHRDGKMTLAWLVACDIAPPTAPTIEIVPGIAVLRDRFRRSRVDLMWRS